MKFLLDKNSTDLLTNFLHILHDHSMNKNARLYRESNFHANFGPNSMRMDFLAICPSSVKNSYMEVHKNAHAWILDRNLRENCFPGLHICVLHAITRYVINQT